MVFWCYILTYIDDNIISNIVNKKYLTIPIKRKIEKNDIIVFYIKNSNNGFIGYVRSKGKLENNIINNKVDVEIFRDKLMNSYGIPIKYSKFIDKRIKKVHIWGDNEKMIKEFKKYLNSGEIFHQMSDELGTKIRDFIKEYQEVDVSEKTVVVTERPTTPIISTSKFIIPILIIPCKKFHRKFKKIEADEKIQWIFEHITFCKLCDITNNNDRVSIDMIYGKTLSFYKMTDEDEIETLINIYYHMDYYKINGMRDNYFKIIRIYNSDNLYHKCLCIIGKLDVAY